MSTIGFLLQNALLGVGLAMDAFSVSLANGLREPRMRPPRMAAMAGVYAFFQFLMPVVGWACVRSVAARFAAFQRFIPWIAFLLLLAIGGKMLLEGLRGEAREAEAVGGGTLLVQGIATSIDALSVGFTLAGYRPEAAFLAALVIAAVTFAVCLSGILLGRRFGLRLSGRADILGGCILIAIGLRILLSALISA